MAYQDEIDDTYTKLAGVSLNLSLPVARTQEEDLELPSVKEIGKTWRVEAFDFKKE